MPRGLALKVLPDDRMLGIVDMYRAGGLLVTIGKYYGLTAPRILQIINSYEKLTGDMVPRRPVGPRPVPMVEWQCPNCHHTKRMVTPLIRDRWKDNSHICKKCSSSKQSVSLEIINNQISERLKGKAWSKVASEFGRSHYLEGPIYRHLLRIKDLDTINRLWPRGIPKWLIREVSGHRVTTRQKK